MRFEMARFRSASREPASWLQKYAHFQNDDWKHRCQKTALLNLCLIFWALTAEKQACKKAKTRKWIKSENYRNEETHVARVWMHVSWLYVENHAVARVLRPSLPLSRLSAVFHERPRRGKGPECMARCCMISQNLPWTSRSIFAYETRLDLQLWKRQSQ